METTKAFNTAEIVIAEGTKGTSAFVILSGNAEVIKRWGDREIVIAILGEGQVFGEMGLIEDRPRSATVRARSDLKVRIIDRDHFNELLRTKPSVLIPILKSLFERLRQASDLIAGRTTDAHVEVGKEGPFEVIIEGQTDEAKKVLDDRKLLITKFPFLIGRISENPESDVFYTNDLFIQEEKPYVVSRNHMAITNKGGMIHVVDRGSSFGTIVNGKEIGGRSNETRASLDREENQVIIGPATSKFIFLLKVVPE
jgi:hypothetical protein